MSFAGALWLNRGMSDFPDIVDEPLRARFAALRVRPDEIEERFVRGSRRGRAEDQDVQVNSHSFLPCLA